MMKITDDKKIKKSMHKTACLEEQNTKKWSNVTVNRAIITGLTFKKKN